MPLFKSVLPANISIVYNMIMKIAAFELFPTDTIVDKLFELPTTQPLTPNFGTVGFESLLLLYNLGSLTVIAILVPVIAIVLRMLAYFSFLGSV